MSDEMIFFNGINGATGDDLLPPKTPREIVAMALGEHRRRDQDDDQKQHLAQVEDRHLRAAAKSMGIMQGVDSRSLAEAGWGVIFSSEDGSVPAVRDALQVLLDHRREQAARLKDRRYRELAGADGYWPGESGIKFLARHKASVTGPVNPDKLPYYLLLVGDPERLPYRFQYELDVQHAVGRLHFDTPDEYARYAASVVQAETGTPARQRRAAFFGVANPGDTATRLSAENLVGPLAGILGRDRPDWSIQTLVREQATKAALGELLGGPQTPALLFTASHGVGFPAGDTCQRPHQGALLCQDWPGREAWPAGRRLPPDFYFSADDVADGAGLLGLLTFHFACFGAGTPLLNDFAHYDDNWEPIAAQPFVARLPQRLLGHPRGGALAVVGHVDRAWDCSFLWNEAGQRIEQLEVFESTLKQLLAGYPVGAAMEYFSDRYGLLSTALTSEMQYVRRGRAPDAAGQAHLASLWTANNDARSYVIVGDPAVRLLAAGPDTPAGEQPALVRVSSQPAAAPAPPAAPAAPAAPPAGSPLVGSQFTLTGTVTLRPDGAGVVPPTLPGAEPADYFLGDKGAETRDKLVAAVQGFAERVGQAVEEAVKSVTTLEVLTYTSDDLAGVDPRNLKGTASLRALTRLKPDGDIEACVPTTDGEVDKSLWQMHVELVRQAQANRVELIKTVVEAVSGLLKGL